MKRQLGYKFAAYSGINPAAVDEVYDLPYEIQEMPLDSVLKEIFSVDSRTGAPRGDISYFLSKDGNPQVKAWLESNLLAHRAKQNGSSIEGVTDDLLAEFSRRSDETGVQYQQRLMSLYDEAKKNYEDLTKKDD